jgi:hypothetical protein
MMFCASRPLIIKIWHRAMRGLQCDRQCRTRHARDVSDIVERRRRGIGGMALSINSMALSALRMGQLTAFSNTANLLRICACKDCDHRYCNDRSAQKRLDRYDLSHCVAPERLQDSKWSGSSVFSVASSKHFDLVPLSSSTQNQRIGCETPISELPKRER